MQSRALMLEVVIVIINDDRVATDSTRHTKCLQQTLLYMYIKHIHFRSSFSIILSSTQIYLTKNIYKYQFY